MDDNSVKSMFLVARIRQEADAKEAMGKNEMARRSRFVADSIERYFGNGFDVAFSEFERNWIDQYIAKLQADKKTENTISNYVRVVHNTCRLAKKEGVDVDLTAFDGVFRGNSKSTKFILSVDQVKAVINTDLQKIFAHTRDIFSLCFFAGGLSFDELCDVAKAEDKINATAEAISVRMQYADSELLSFLGNESVRKANYLQNLKGLASELRLDRELNDDSAAEAWAEVAKKCGVAHNVIAAVVGREIANLNYSDCDAEVSQDEMKQALATVAKYVGVNTQHWYAVNCRTLDKDDVVKEIMAMPNVKRQYVKHFSPVVSRNPLKKVTETENNLMKSILFIHCLDKDAVTIRKALAPNIYVYDCQCDGKKKPAPISENEMKTFMYLSGISTDAILSYFPDELSKLKQFKKFEEVTITTGQFAGQKAIVDKEADKLNVLVKFTMVNMYFVVKVPKKDLISAAN